MKTNYTFYGLFGGRATWRPPAGDLTISANGIQWPGSKPCDRQPDPAEVAICRAFLARCERTKHPITGSYRLKHLVESRAGEYVSNGALIAAARDLGIEFVVSRGNPNAVLCVSKRSVRRRLKEAA